MHDPKNIFITGFSGSGKTTVGRIAARLLGWAFVDLDNDIERAAGLAIEQIFAPVWRGALQAAGERASCGGVRA